MISPALFAVTRCPECTGTLTPQSTGAVCGVCHRVFDGSHQYLDLRPLEAFAEQTKYLDEALHVDAHEQLRPLAAGMIMGVAVREEAAPRGIDTEEDLRLANDRWTTLLSGRA